MTTAYSRQPLISALGYLGISSPRHEDWKRFGGEFLGAQVTADGPDGATRLKFDKERWRIQVHPGEADKAEYFGWLVTYEEQLEEIRERLDKAGVTASAGPAELAADRAVNKLITFTDPWGFAHEVAWGQVTDPEPFRPGRGISGFVTGSQGLGHVLVLIPDIEAGHEFFSGVLGFELSDKIITPDGRLNARFYHVNARHHTLALAQGPKDIAVFNHLMLQVNSIDDVGWAYDRLEEFEVPQVLSLGRHTNDQMVSFYCRTPSGFQVEYGHSGLEITPDWVARTYTAASLWGHKFNHSAGGGPGIVHPIAPAP